MLAASSVLYLSLAIYLDARLFKLGGKCRDLEELDKKNLRHSLIDPESLTKEKSNAEKVDGNRDDFFI